MQDGSVNLIFGVLVYFVLIANTGNFVTTTVNEIVYLNEDGLSSFTIGDEIIKINGKRVRTNSDIKKIMENNNGEEITVMVKNNGEEKTLSVKPIEIIGKETGIYLDGTREDTVIVVNVKSESVAETSQIQINDIITKINGNEVNNPYQLLNLMNNIEDDGFNLEIKRENETIECYLEPKKISTYYLGVSFKIAEDTIFSKIYYSFWSTIDLLKSLGNNIKTLFSGQIETDQLMGPVGISSVVADTRSFSEYIYIIGMISISLGVTNLLPFPPLDGGKVVIYLIEAIRKKKMTEEFELKLQMVGFSILIMLSLYITYNDVLRII